MHPFVSRTAAGSQKHLQLFHRRFFIAVFHHFAAETVCLCGRRFAIGRLLARGRTGRAVLRPHAHLRVCIRLFEHGIPINMERGVRRVDVQPQPERRRADAEMAVFAPIRQIPDLREGCAFRDGFPADQGAAAEPPELVQSRTAQLHEEILHLLPLLVGIRLAFPYERVHFVFSVLPYLGHLDRPGLPAGPVNVRDDVHLRLQQHLQRAGMKDQVRVRQKQMRKPAGERRLQHVILHRGHFPDQRFFPEMRFLGADVCVVLLGLPADNVGSRFRGEAGEQR